MAEELPQQFGNYTLHTLIARGGMAEIYRATMPGIGGFEKTVAIKKILPHLAENEEFITMLKDEANILVSISHSNIAQVYDLGKIDDTYYISMEYVHGLDLSGIIKTLEKRGEYLPIPHAVYIGSCMCAGLHAAHTNTDKQGNRLNIVHRDVSPHNVIISFAGDVKLIDFGVAKAAVKESHTQMGVIKGKLLYMAPEQAMAKDLDGRADLFAVGLCMYKMLTYELPFRGENEFQIYNNILSKEIVPPRQLNPAVPEEVNQIVMTLLQRDPDKRYQDGYSAKQDLERALHNIAPGYTVNRLSRFVEDNFSQAAKQRQDAQDISGPKGVAPETPSANAVGTGQLTSGADIPELQPVSVEDSNPGRQRVRASNQGPPPTPGPPAQPASLGPGGAMRTQTNQEEITGDLDAEELARGAAGETKSGPPAAVYAIGVMVVVIVGLVVYAVVFGGKKETPAPAPKVAASAKSATTPTPAPAPSPMVHVSLDSRPSKATLFRGDDELGTTPTKLVLRRGDKPIELTLRKDGYEELAFEVVPDSDIDQTIDLVASDGAGADAGIDAAAADEQPAEKARPKPADHTAPKPAPKPAPTAHAAKPGAQQALAATHKHDKAPVEQPKPDKKPSKAPPKPAAPKPEPHPSGQAPPPSDEAPSLFDDAPDEKPAPKKKTKSKTKDKNKGKKSQEIIDPFG